jgi:hypothetical protein
MYQLLKGGKSDHQSIFFNVASLTKPALNRQDLTSVLDQLAPIAIQMDKDLGGVWGLRSLQTLVYLLLSTLCAPMRLGCQDFSLAAPRHVFFYTLCGKQESTLCYQTKSLQLEVRSHEVVSASWQRHLCLFSRIDTGKLFTYLCICTNAGKFPTIDEKPLNPIFVPSIVDHAFTGRESMNIDGVEGLLRRKLNRACLPVLLRK